MFVISTSSSIFANLVGGLTQPIFNGRKIRTAYEVAKIEQEQSLLSFKQALLTAGKEVSEELRQKLAAKVKAFQINNPDFVPGLAIVQVC